MVQAPRVPVLAEDLEMKKLINTYGKTFHTWQVDRGDTLPLGQPPPACLPAVFFFTVASPVPVLACLYAEQPTPQLPMLRQTRETILYRHTQSCTAPVVCSIHAAVQPASCMCTSSISHTAGGHAVCCPPTAVHAQCICMKCAAKCSLSSRCTCDRMFKVILGAGIVHT